MKRVFLLIGAPGSGKTSTAKKVSLKIQNLSHYSIGEIFRIEVKNKTKTGKTIEKFLEKGITVPINVAVGLIVNTIEKCNTSNMIIDGFPRDKEQLCSFVKLNKKYTQQAYLIEISVPKDVAKERILARNRGVDDQEIVFDKRMMYYLKYRQIMINFFNLKNKYFKLNGNTKFKNVCNSLYSLLIELKI